MGSLKVADIVEHERATVSADPMVAVLFWTIFGAAAKRYFFA